MEKNKKIMKLFFIGVLIGILLLGSVVAIRDCQVIQISRHYLTPYSNNFNDRLPYERQSYSYGGRFILEGYRQHATQEARKDFVGSYVKEYSVSVTNKERTGKYYTVKFNFRDKKDYGFSESITKYLKDGERKNFVYKDIQFERYEIVDWNYRVIPENN